MVLVNYSDSDVDSESDTKNDSLTKTTFTHPHKRKAQNDVDLTSNKRSIKSPPPLPSTFHTLYSTNVRASTSDDPSLHGGRTRQISHVVGNWPSHVYLEWLPGKSQLSQLDTMIAQVQDLLVSQPDKTSNTGSSPLTVDDDLILHTFLRTPLSAQLPLHVSLSAPLVLSTSTKDAFRTRLHDALTSAKIGPTVVVATSLDLVPNFERSRWFLILRVEEVENGGRLERLLQACNGVCGEFGLSKLYTRGMRIGVGKEVEAGNEGEGGSMVDAGKHTEDSERGTGVFHVSIAWMLKGVSEEVKDSIQEIQVGSLGQTRIHYDCVKVKVGNVVEDVVL